MNLVDIEYDTILNNDNLQILYNQIYSCRNLNGMSAEIGVYKGNTSKLIKNILNKTHYCYDTFEGICDSFSSYGDKHKNGEFECNLEFVKKNINMDNIIYKKGNFPETFQEDDIIFSFVYSDTATYFGAKNTFQKFKNNIITGGKMIFYIDDNCTGIKKAIIEFETIDDSFIVLYQNNFVIFIKK